MPVYDYKCTDHGLFHELATIDEHANPSPCPECQNLSPRVIMISPDILDMDLGKKQAIEKNETAQYEPQISTIDTRAENTEKLAHGSGCQHKKRSSKLLYLADGSKIFPSMRPWMISH